MDLFSLFFSNVSSGYSVITSGFPLPWYCYLNISITFLLSSLASRITNNRLLSSKHWTNSAKASACHSSSGSSFAFQSHEYIIELLKSHIAQEFNFPQLILAFVAINKQRSSGPITCSFCCRHITIL